MLYLQQRLYESRHRHAQYVGYVTSVDFRSMAFAEAVAAQRGAMLRTKWSSADATLDGAEHGIAWSVDLSPSGSETDSSITFRAPDIRADRQWPRMILSIVPAGTKFSGGGLGDVDGAAAIVVGVVAGAAALWQRRKAKAKAEQAQAPAAEPVAEAAPKRWTDTWAITDPCGIVDDAIRERFAEAPVAHFASGQSPRPITFGNARLRPDGLVVVTERWWASAEALNVQIDLGLALARRVEELRRTG